MNLALISPYPDITAFGLRTISAYLKEHGHHTKLIFLPDRYGDDLVFGVERYDDGIMEDVVESCSDADLIGITLMTNFFDNAVQVTRKLKASVAAPIIWGGVHPTIRPEECLEYCDMVCLGDGEDAMLEVSDKMAAGEDYSQTENIWLRSKGEVVKNPLKKLRKNLDIYPPPDYSHEDHYIMTDRHLTRLTWELTRTFLQGGSVSAHLGMIGYQTMTGRGCPHKCTYCINDTIKNLYKGQCYLRWRSADHVMSELLWVKEHLQFVQYIWISDDAFFARKLQDLEKFCSEYKDKIALPFSCLGSPLTVTNEKMKILVDAGLIYLQVGIESGSKRIQELFNRKQMSNERMLKTIKIINKYKEKMKPPSYDFILDVPYESEDDKIQSLRFIAEIPKPFTLQPFSLVLYPGTALYKQAKKDGFIKDERRDIYGKSYTMREPSYLNLLMALSKGGRLPQSLLRFLVSNKVLKVLNSRTLKPFFRYLYIGLQIIYQSMKSMRKGKRKTYKVTVS